MSSLGTFLRGATPRPNAAPALRITLARRLVETAGAPFVPSEEVFTDVASARDELGLLPAAQGPTVVRVQVEGGTDEDLEALHGDWLCDPDVGGPAVRIPWPKLPIDQAPRKKDRSWLFTWEACADADWMLRAAMSVGVDRRLIVLASCKCAGTSLQFLRSATEQRPRCAIETAEKWTRGEVGIVDVQRAAAAAADVADVAASAATLAAELVFDDAAWIFMTAAQYAADAAASCVPTGVSVFYSNAVRRQALAQCADLVRVVIPTLTVLRAVVARV